MENQEFVIKGTVDGMIKILKNDFSMPLEEAKFFVYVMVNQYSRDTVHTINRQELDIWYLSDDNKYEGRIRNTHLAINFTTVKKNIYHQAYLFFVKYFFNRKIDLIIIGTELIYLVVSSIQKIEDTDYCVYARIIEQCMGNKNSYFDIDDIVIANKYGKCDYQEDGWNCTYLGQEENCTCDEKKISLAFGHLSSQGIIKQVGERWKLVH